MWENNVLDKKTGHRVTNPRNHVEFSDSLEWWVTHIMNSLMKRDHPQVRMFKVKSHCLAKLKVNYTLVKELTYESSNSWVLGSVHRKKLIPLKASENHPTECKLLVYKKQSPCSLVSDSLGKDPLTSALK